MSRDQSAPLRGEVLAFFGRFLSHVGKFDSPRDFWGWQVCPYVRFDIKAFFWVSIVLLSRT